MQELEVYNPFGVSEYKIITKDDRNFFVYDDNLIELVPNGFIPKSGLLFDEVLTPNICKGKSILDLGCGYLGILSLISKKNGACHIDAIDYDDNCVNWFKKIIADNHFENLNCFKSDYFSFVYDNYDIILSNPPQMPMIHEAIHDSGGYDGREHIINVIKESFNHLNVGGKLFLLVFDFLGTDKRTNDNFPSIFELAYNVGYKSVKKVFETRKNIKKESVTYNNLNQIKSVYPLYDFDNNNLYCNIQILEMEK